MENLIRSWFAELDAGRRTEAYQTRTADDIVVATPMGTFEGRDGAGAFVDGFYTAFPDLRHEVEGVTENDAESATVQLRIVGTNDGPMQSPGGAIPATGKPLDMRAESKFTLRDGRIARI